MYSNVLIKPLVTEKITGQQEKLNLVGFIVKSDANKIQIAKAVKDKYKVDVLSVKTLLFKGKTKTQFHKRGRFTGKTSKFKKAIITLKEGQKIDFFENL